MTKATANCKYWPSKKSPMVWAVMQLPTEVVSTWYQVPIAMKTVRGTKTAVRPTQHGRSSGAAKASGKTTSQESVRDVVDLEEVRQGEQKKG